MNRIFISLFLFLALCAALCVALPTSAFAQTPDPLVLDKLSEQQKTAEKNADATLERQSAVQHEISGLQRDLVSATAQSRGFERAQSQAQRRLSELKREEKTLSALILNDRDSLSDILAALQRIERRPAPSLLSHSKSAVDAARAARLLSTLSHDLHTKSEALRLQLGELKILRLDINENKNAVSKNAHELDTRLENIKAMISNKAILNTRLDATRKTQTEKAKALAAEARNLRDLIARFEAQAEEIMPRLKPKKGTFLPSPRLKPKRGKTPPPVFVPAGSGRFTDARGKLALPVLGTLSRRFGARMSGGERAKGISLRTASRAQVVAPFPGRIEFSGQFNHEHVVILNVGNGYFIVLTGLGETFSSTGERVDAGEPLGLMPQRTGTKPELFMEIRKNRTSIDPKPWIGAALAR